MKKGLIIYDFDGVLVDSKEAVILYYKALFDHFNLPHINWDDPEEMSLIFGMSQRQMLTEHMKIPEGKKLENMCNYMPNIFEKILERTFLEKGVKETLPMLSKDYNLAICTNRGSSPEIYLKRFGINSFFSYIITAKDVMKPKPSPEGLKKILSYFNSDNALYIGDSEVDYIAAKDAKVEFISFGTKISDCPIITDHNELYKFL